MPAIANCPTRETLQRFVLGLLTPEDVERLAGHVEGCPVCVNALHEVQSQDTVIEAMQGATASTVETSTPNLSALIARLSALKLPETQGTIALEPNSMRSDIPVSNTIFGEEAVDFLTPAQSTEEIGRLGSYRVLKVLGTGGMGVVFMAEDTQLKRIVALKTMKPAIAANPVSRQRFLREAQAAAHIENDHVVPIFQVGEDRGVPYLAMPFLKGLSLEDRLNKEKRLTLEQTLKLGVQIARGLMAAHELGLFHRDIKPANLWIEPEQGGRIKILDFGLARGADEQSHLTQSGTIVGTPAYMAPEQARGEQVDGRCDLFSLGCVLYRMLTGVQPFQRPETMATLMALAMHEPPSPHEIDNSIPKALSEVVMRLLAKEPVKRVASAKEVIAALQTVSRQQTLPTKEDIAFHEQHTETTLAPLPSRRRRVPFAAVAALLLAGVGLAAWQIIIRITDKDGKPREIEVPPGGKVEIAEKDKGGKKPDEKPGVSSLDKLDAANIPAEERFPWQPKELVAVVGEHRGRHWGRIHNLSFSPDGKSIVSVGDYRGQIYDATTLQLRSILPTQVTSAAYSADRKMLVIATHTFDVAMRGLWLWDVTGPEPKRGLKIMDGLPQDIALSTDGKRLAVNNILHDKSIRLWDLGGEKPRELPGIKDLKSISVMALSPDGNSLFIGSDAGKKLQLWDLTGPEPKERAVLGGATMEGYSIGVFSPDRKTLATYAAFEGIIRLWDLTTVKPKERAVIKKGPQVMTFAPDSKTLAAVTDSGGPLAVVRLFDLSGADPVERVKLEVTGSVLALAFAPDGKSFATGSGEGQVRRWDVTGKELVPLEGSTGPLATAVVTADGKSLATCAPGDNRVRLWDVTGATPNQRAVVEFLRYSNHFIALSGDGKTLVSASDHGGVGVAQVWDITSAQPEERNRIRSDKIHFRYPVLFPDGKKVIFQGLGDSTLRIWDVSTPEGKELAILKDSDMPCLIAPDGKTLICGVSKKQTPRVWNLSGAEPTDRGELEFKSPYRKSSYGTPTALFPDGKTLATGCGGGGIAEMGILLWDLSTARPKEGRFLPVNLARIQTITISPDGTKLAAATSGGDLLCWDLEKKPSLALTDKDLIERHMKQATLKSWKLPGQINAVTFAPDGKHLITANANGTAYVLRLGD